MQFKDKDGATLLDTENIAGDITIDDEPTADSTNAVSSGGVYAALQNVESDIRHIEKLATAKHKMLAGEAVNIACFGDSITMGHGGTIKYSDVLQENLRRIYCNDMITVYNYGVGGCTSGDAVSTTSSSNRQIRTYVPSDTITYDVAIVMYGINDTSGLVQNYTADEHRGYMEEIITYLLGNNVDVVVMSSSRVSGYADITGTHYGSFFDRRIRSMSQVDEELARKYNLLYIDLGAEIQDAINHMSLRPAFIYSDKAHFNNSGYTAIGHIVTKYFEDFSFKNAEAGTMYLPLVRDNAVITDCTTVDNAGEITARALKMSGTQHLYCDFFNSMRDCTIELHGNRISDGAVLNIQLDGTNYAASFAGSATKSYETICTINNVGYGYHRLTIDCANITSGTYVYANFLKFINA